MKRCPECGFRADDTRCPLCGVKMQAMFGYEAKLHAHSEEKETCGFSEPEKPTVHPPMHVHPEKGEHCVLPNTEQAGPRRKSAAGNKVVGVVVALLLYALLKACTG